MSAYNTWMCSYGKDESGKLIEPEPWQLHYIGCGLLFDSSSEHSDAHGQTCKGMCRAEPGALVVKAADSTLLERVRVKKRCLCCAACKALHQKLEAPALACSKRGHQHCLQ
eukprot:11207-Heterococcus_DN1.PRE.1